MTATSQIPPPVAERVRSVDALRGFDMFWILGAGLFVKALEKMSDGAPIRTIADQLQHVQWEGVRFYDFIFPLFLFIVGVSLVFSLDRTLARNGRAKAVLQIVRRSALLYLLGIFYTGGLSHRWPDVTLGGVLHRIAACYLFAALIYVWCASRLKVIAGIAAALLVGYWALLTFVPFPDLKLENPAVEEIAKRIGSDSPAAIAAAVPERVHGLYEESRNLANYLDFRFLPGKKMAVYFINEGLLSTLPSIAICLFGIFAGRLLKSGADPRRKVALLLAAGAAGIQIGWLWSFQFPLIKRIWTSSFILVASGYSAMLLGLFYYIVDVRKWSRWCEPFVWIGMNPITLYLSTRVISYSQVAEMFVGGDVKAFFDARAQGLGSLVVATFALGLVFLLAWFLHRRRIFLRV
jgi:predicted acyltransferase